MRGEKGKIFAVESMQDYGGNFKGENECKTMAEILK